ncbi:hypothetical protein HF086_015421 [Spodoptera exigua]|uniref:Phosphodiesterase n=1 Tax=Spodoptera exigua TaxID=7107 RepID=A0A922MWT1_SPOEX|nr:hypothetical protein HF086_015421 [Spodoptera exigua]
MDLSSYKKPKRKSIQHSDPGKILDLIMSLTDETCNEIQIKINTYLEEECDADLVVPVIVHRERKEAYIEVVGTTALPRERKIHLTQKLTDALKSKTEQTDLLTNFGEDFQSIVSPHLPKDSTKKRLVLFSVTDCPFSVIFCVVSPKAEESSVPITIYECGVYVWPTLKKAIALEYEKALKIKCQQLLRVAKRLFAQVASLETLMQIAMDQAKQLTKAEHCTVMLIDIDNMELYESCSTCKDSRGRRCPLGMGIAGEVIKTGLLINSRVPKENPAYNPAIDGLPNKECSMDEEMVLAFSIYCGVCIMHSVVYQKIEEAHIRNALANELVMYHMKVTDAEVSRMMTCNGFHQHPHISNLHFNPRALPLRELPCYAVKMFTDLGLHVSDLQALMYMIAAFVHDIDHRGTTNSFQIHGETTLAALYSSEGSVMERHHLAQAMCILNTEGCDILAALPRRDYDRAIMMLRDNILATDLANYFKNYDDYRVVSMDYQKPNRLHCSALQCLLMNAADLSDQLKDWGCVKKTAVPLTAGLSVLLSPELDTLIDLNLKEAAKPELAEGENNAQDPNTKTT